MNFNDIVITATLKNEKRIVIEPNYIQEKVQYRYLTDKEIINNQIDVNGTFVWMESRMYSTVDKGFRLIFCNIEGTGVLLNRF